MNRPNDDFEKTVENLGQDKTPKIKTPLFKVECDWEWILLGWFKKLFRTKSRRDYEA
jgi:hypothetical protein